MSRGRTIRQFVLGTLIIPFTFTLLWLSVFGNSALYEIIHGGAAFAEEAMVHPERGFYSLLAQYPAFTFSASVATITGLLFYVTSADSGALVLGTGTQANLVALLSHCERGEEYIVGQAAHNYLFEAGGAAVLGSIQPQPIDAAADGTLPLDKVAMKIKPDDIHFARTKLLSLENTHNGKVLPREYLKEAWEFTRERNLALHVDGARIFNAVVAYGCELKEITQYCDSFTICLSKGLGTPVGSLLVGNRDYIKRAIRWRKMTGGGMRQSGILAAAGMYALK
ncbi:low-specificity L-threonine aldolase, partial [Escherichia coli]|nr:low-specificity L-threonine aldolase [Escherichia coli]